MQLEKKLIIVTDLKPEKTSYNPESKNTVILDTGLFLKVSSKEELESY